MPPVKGNRSPMDTRDIKDLTPSTLAALAKLTSDAAKETRDSLAPGEYAVDQVVTLYLDGTVKVSADTDRVPTSSIPLLPALALLAKRMGVQRPAVLAILREVMTEALTMGKDAATELIAEYGLKEVEEQIKQEVLAQLPRVPVKGTVKVKGKAALPKV